MRQKYRDLAPQLKDPSNQDLNADLFLNRITPDELIIMTAAQLAPSSMKEKRAKEAKWAREAARSDLTIGDGATDAFLCESCNEAGRPGRRCVFFQQQTRGADEPMTIFGPRYTTHTRQRECVHGNATMHGAHLGCVVLCCAP